MTPQPADVTVGELTQLGSVLVDLYRSLISTDPAVGQGNAVIPDSVGVAWFLAGCNRCEPDFGHPFPTMVERDMWAVQHAQRGHAVLLTTAAVGQPRRPMLLRYSQRPSCSGTRWSWLCLTDECRRWVDEYDTGQLALTGFREHSCAGSE